MTRLRRFYSQRRMAAVCITLGTWSCFGHTQLLAQFSREVVSARVLSRAESGEQTRTGQSVYLNGEGELVGQVQILGTVSSRSAKRMKVSMLTTDGQAVDTTVDQTGTFAFANVPPGVCALFGHGDGVVVCQSIQVLENEGQADDVFQLYAVSPVTREMEKLVFSRTKEMVANKSDTLLPSAPQTYGVPNGVVALSDDGRMQGQLWSVRGNVSVADVRIYQNGIAVARTTADGSGKFAVKLGTGVYALVASGTGGVAAVGFKAESASSTTSKANTPKNIKLVSLTSPAVAPILVVGLAPPQESIGPSPEPAIVESVDTPVADGFVSDGLVGGRGFGGGGFGGSSVSGGGGGGGLSSRRGLAAFAAIGGLTAVAITASASNNDNAKVVSPSGQ